MLKSDAALGAVAVGLLAVAVAAAARAGYGKTWWTVLTVMLGLAVLGYALLA